MKKTAIIINTARGGVINERDLDKALREKIIFGAGIELKSNFAFKFTQKNINGARRGV